MEKLHNDPEIDVVLIDSPEEDVDISDEAQSFRPHKVSREEPKKEEEKKEEEVDLDKISIGCNVKILDIEFDEELEYKIVGGSVDDTCSSGGGCAGGVLEVNTKLCAKNGVCTSGVITWRNYGFL